MNHSGSTPVFGILSSDSPGNSSSWLLVQFLYISYLVFRFRLRALAVTAIFSDFYREILPQLCRDFAAMRQGCGKFFFSWTAILLRTYPAHFRPIYRDRYREFCRGYIRDFAAIQTEILPRLYPHFYHNAYRLFVWQLAAGLPRSCCTFCCEFAASLLRDVFWVYHEFAARCILSLPRVYHG
jgi:hypothetical protein